MKVILLNGSPRKNWNTHRLLLEAERGAKEMGAETELIHLFELKPFLLPYFQQKQYRQLSLLPMSVPPFTL